MIRTASHLHTITSQRAYHSDGDVTIAPVTRGVGIVQCTRGGRVDAQRGKQRLRAHLSISLSLISRCYFAPRRHSRCIVIHLEGIVAKSRHHLDTQLSAKLTVSSFRSRSSALLATLWGGEVLGDSQ